MLKFGCDLVIYSVIKFIGGYGDVVVGIVVGNEEVIFVLCKMM